MTLKITKQHEPIEVKNITVLIYSPPGVGKTSLASTADSPLLLDFDRGAYRSEFRKDTVQVDSWADVVDITESDLESYSTVVVDTVGRLLDALSTDIIKKNPKMKGYGGALTLQGYGALKAEYAGWLKMLQSFGKDVILIAHDKEDKNGDDLIIRPDIQGGSYGEVFKRADGVAYMYVQNRQRMLDFNPTDRWVGKNSGGFDPLAIPNFHQSPDYMAGILQSIKDALNKMSEEGMKIMQQVDDWRAKIEEATDAEEVNHLVAEVKKLEPPVGPQAAHMLKTRAESLGLTYEGEKGKGKYVAKAEEAA